MTIKILNIFSGDNALSSLTIVSFGLFPILPNSIKGLPIVILILNTIIIFFKVNKFENKVLLRKRFLYALLMTSIYICYLLSGFYTENTAVLVQKLETSLSLFLVPMCFIFVKINIRLIGYFKFTFVVSTIVFIVFFWTHILLNTNGIALASISTDMLRNQMETIPLISLNSIYASMIFSISVFLLLSLLNKINNYVLWLIVVILVLNIAVLVSKMVIVSLFIIIVYFLLKSKPNIYFKIISIFLTTITLIAAILFVPNLRQRFNEVALPRTYEKVIIWNSTSIRKGINDCSIILLKKQWFFGYGLGDVQDNLNSCYKLKSEVLENGKYNSHNQYFGIWLGTGFLGLMIFLFMLIYNFILALRYKDLLFQVIIIFFALNFLTENVLQRQVGVIAFSLLFNLFGWTNFNRIAVMDLGVDKAN